MLLSILLVGTVVYLMWLWFNRDTRLQALPGPKGLLEACVVHLNKLQMNVLTLTT